MSLEASMKDVIENKLSDGTIERILSEKFEKSISETIEDLFRKYGDVGKQIEKKLSEVLVPAIERHDFSDYIVKLDTVLSEIVSSTVLTDNKKILENFRELMTEGEMRKTITVSELFEKWCDYVAEEVETTRPDVKLDDGVEYENVPVTMRVVYEESYRWSDFERANIIFECEQDEKMNCMIPVNRWEKYDGDKWTIAYERNPSIKALKYLGKFEVYLLRLQRMFCRLEIDSEGIEEEVIPEKLDSEK